MKQVLTLLAALASITIAPTLAFEHSNISKLEVQIKDSSIKLSRVGQTWQVAEWNSKPVANHRANNNLINHLVDLLRWRTNGISRKDTLVFKKTEDPKNPWITSLKNLQSSPTNSQILKLLKGKTALDFRDRHFTSFEPDDVEEIRSTGHCKSIVLFRDGDRWVWKSKTPTTSSTAESWLEGLLSMQSNQIDEMPRAKSKHTCQLELIGRHAQKEIITLEQTHNAMWAINPTLHARFKLEASQVQSFIPMQ